MLFNVLTKCLSIASLDRYYNQWLSECFLLKLRMENVERQWLFATKNVPKSTSEQWWSTIVAQYTTTGREAHNITYLENKFEELKTFCSAISNLNAFIFALIFQYFHYDARDSDFSSKNLENFETFAAEAGLTEVEGLVSNVKQLLETSSIYSTEEPKIDGAFGEDDVHYFLDLDMAVLGRDSEEYAQYTNNVEREYSFLTADAYKNLRKKVLQSFLLIPNIFATRLFREKYEESARRNIELELKKLSN